MQHRMDKNGARHSNLYQIHPKKKNLIYSTRNFPNNTTEKTPNISWLSDIMRKLLWYPKTDFHYFFNFSKPVILTNSEIALLMLLSCLPGAMQMI
jgi:hypothetical protein